MMKIAVRYAALVFVAFVAMLLVSQEADACESMKIDKAAVSYGASVQTAELSAADDCAAGGACHDAPCCHVGACCGQTALHTPSVKNTYSYNFGHVTQSMYSPAVLSLLPHSIERPPKLFS